MKSEIFNLIILDESGSMGGVVKQTISGCNETLNTIRSAQKQFAETQQHFISIFAFQSNGSRPSRYLCKNVAIDEARDITPDDYCPCGCTPLYDAVGSTLADLKATTYGKKFSIGSVTIITDGMENSSKHYSGQQVAREIEALKELGWSFNFIGANIDVMATAKSLNIENAMEFIQDDKGIKHMFACESRSRMNWLKRSQKIMKKNLCDDSACSEEDFRKEMRDASKNYFDEDNDCD